jgi:protein-L-isoaspartate(D-aspartate) O-methyltransferase
MGLSVTRLEGDDLKAVPAGSYDVIICEGAVAIAPKAWQDALAVGGRLGVVERTGPVGRAAIYLRSEDGVGRRQAFDASPPLLAGFEAEVGFSF